MATSSQTSQVRVWSERALVLGTVVCLSWVCATWWRAVVYQQRAREQFVANTGGATATVEIEGPEASEPVARDSVIGVLGVPALGLSVAVREGDDEEALRTAAGHLADTPLPWQRGNVAIAGHRDTFFRRLRNLRVGDALQLTTRHGTFQYRVRRLMVVDPKALWVLDDSDGVTLTLITCYPFSYIGPAPQRFIVQAGPPAPD